MQLKGIYNHLHRLHCQTKEIISIFIVSYRRYSNSIFVVIQWFISVWGSVATHRPTEIVPPWDNIFDCNNHNVANAFKGHHNRTHMQMV